MNIYARQGDLVFHKIGAVPVAPDKLEKKQGVILAGTDTAPHMIGGTVLHAQQDRVHYLHIIEPTEVTHQGRHLPVKLEAGYYEVRPLRERGDKFDRMVED